MLTLSEEHWNLEQVVEALGTYTYIGQLEQGMETGYRHWQVYVENENPVSFKTLQRKFPRGAHFEPRRESRAACWRYVTKEETAVEGVARIGSMEEPPSEAGSATTLDAMRASILTGEKTARDLLLFEPAAARHTNYFRELESAYRAETASKQFRDIEVTYIYGAPGIGKTHSIYDAEGFGSMFSVSSYANPFDAYNYESALLLDEFRGQLEFEYLLKVLDRYPLQLKCRYADKWATYKRVYLVSNVPLDDLYPEVRTSRPDQWNALCRRITNYGEMVERGVVEPRSLPVRPVRSSRAVAEPDLRA